MIDYTKEQVEATIAEVEIFKQDYESLLTAADLLLSRASDRRAKMADRAVCDHSTRQSRGMTTLRDKISDYHKDTELHLVYLRQQLSRKEKEAGLL